MDNGPDGTGRTRRASLTWGKRIVATILLFCALGYGVLTLAGKNRDAMRLGIEEYLEKLTGADAQITDLGRLELVPRVVFGMKGVILSDRADKARTLLHADEAYVSVPFASLMFGIGRYYALQAKNVDVASGFGLPRKTALSFLGISDPDPDAGQPMFMAEGTYGGRPVLITAGMDRHKGRTYYSYSFPAEYPLTFKIGAIEGDGIVERNVDGGKFKKVQMVRGAHRVDFVLRRFGKDAGPMEAEGSIDGAEFTGMQREEGGRTVFALSLSSPKPGDAEGAASFVAALNDDMGFSKDAPFFVMDRKGARK